MTIAPFFIVGNPRSGTTMLRLMLTSHPRIGVPPESNFVVLLGWVYGQRTHLGPADYRSFVDAFFGMGSAVDWGLDPTRLREHLEEVRPAAYPQVVDAVYRHYLDTRFPAKTRWGDKTTWYIDHLPLLSSLFPEARFLHLVRDVRDVACSYRKMQHMPHRVSDIALTWTTNLDTVRRQRQRLGDRRFLEVRYEDLVERTEAELTRICGFLDERYSEEMLSFWRKNRDERLEPERHMGWKKQTEEPVSTASVGRWRDELTPRQVATIEAIAGRNLAAKGYDLEMGARRDVWSIGGDAVARAYGVYWRSRQAARRYKSLGRYELARVGVGSYP